MASIFEHPRNIASPPPDEDPGDDYFETMDLIVVASHPIQYQACIWRELARVTDLRFEVWYGSDYGVRPQASIWGVRDFAWDVDLTTGYPHRFLPNWSPWPAPDTYAGKLCPGLAVELIRARPRAVLVQGYRNLHEQTAILSGKLSGARLLFRADTNARARRNAIRAIVRRGLLCALYPALDAILAIGPDNRRHYEEHGVPAEKLFQAPHAVDQDFFQTAARNLTPNRHALRSELGLPIDRPVVLFAGVLRRIKGVDLAIRAISRLAGFHLAIAGSGGEMGSLRTLAEALAPSRVHFLGFLNQRELAKAYAAADLFCLPSRVEPWGLVVNEAIAMGTPVVVTDVCGVAADVGAAKAGLVVPPDDAESLANAFHQALESARAGFFDSGMRAFNAGHHPRATAEAIVAAIDGRTAE